VQTLSEIRQLLADRGLRPKHRFGQNFLHDKNQLKKLVEAAHVQAGDVVLEVGPGTGTLTEALLETGATVIACELDVDMAAIMAERFGARITLIRGDALVKQRELNPQIVSALAGRPFKLVANLPYQIASPLITTLLIDHANCTCQFITIQKEVAERLSAAPSTKAYGPLSVIVQVLAEVERIATLSRGCFWPEPEVTSAMVAVRPRGIEREVETSTSQQINKSTGPQSPVSGGRDCGSMEMWTCGLVGSGRGRDFARFVVDLFTKRRKQLGGIIGREHSNWSGLKTLGMTPDLRPEALTPDQIVRLWQHLARNKTN
jgi:16S rRNA (adenine1518-N6/adenine1519-N6)-dimethyltransferase